MAQTLAKFDYIPVAIPIASQIEWLELLNEKERNEFVFDILLALHEAAATGNFRALRNTYESWKATAEVIGEPELARKISESEREIKKGKVKAWNDVKRKLKA